MEDGILLCVPFDILIIVINNIKNIDDIISVISVCKYLRSFTFSNTYITIQTGPRTMKIPFLLLFTKARISYLYIDRNLNINLHTRFDCAFFPSHKRLKSFLKFTPSINDNLRITTPDMDLILQGNSMIIYKLPTIPNEEEKCMFEILGDTFERLSMLNRIDNFNVDITLCNDACSLPRLIENISNYDRPVTLTVASSFTRQFIIDEILRVRMCDRYYDPSEMIILNESEISCKINEFLIFFSDYIWNLSGRYIFDLLLMRNSVVLCEMFLDMLEEWDYIPATHYLILYLNSEQKTKLLHIYHQKSIDYPDDILLYYNKEEFIERCSLHFQSLGRNPKTIILVIDT